MANVRHPGFYPTRTTVGGGTISYVKRRTISSNTNAISIQDVVTADNAGDILGTATTSTLATKIDSVAMGCRYVDSSGVIKFGKLPATTTFSGTTVFPVNAPQVLCVADMVSTEFRASIDTASALTNLRNNYPINLRAGVGDYSQQDLAGSTATTSTLPIRLISFIDTGESDPDAADCHVIVKANRGFTDPALLDGTGT